VRVFHTLQELAACVGQHVATSDWVTITQAQINQFAQATGDQQWIHVDVERATAGPFGAPIAHGFLTLSLIPVFLESALRVEQSGMVVNYGLNKVRFIAPVRVNSRLRAQFALAQVDAVDKGGVQLTWDVTLECEGAAKPVCAAQSLVRLYP
jgi:acyl dehydratase